MALRKFLLIRNDFATFYKERKRKKYMKLKHVYKPKKTISKVSR